ncbi:DUF2382 domain-containing protein [Kytococcus sp. Marseille-QA3725]
MDSRASDRTSMVRHEERLNAAVQQVDRRITRVRKRVITETVNVEVEVQREVIEVEEGEVETVPVDAGSAPSGTVVEGADLEARDVTADAREEEVQVFTLHRQRPVVTLETVPYEEVRVVKRVVTVPHEVTETVRREHVDVDEVDAHGGVVGDFR